MRLMRRMQALETALGAVRQPVVVFLDGVPDETWRAQVADARARALPVTVVQLALTAAARTPAEAEALVARHREQFPTMPVTVAVDGAIAASFDPGLPSEFCVLGSFE